MKTQNSRDALVKAFNKELDKNRAAAIKAAEAAIEAAKAEELGEHEEVGRNSHSCGWGATVKHLMDELEWQRSQVAVWDEEVNDIVLVYPSNKK